MTRPRPIPLLVAILGVLGVGIFCALMALRIVRYNAEQGRVVYAFMEVHRPSFAYAGHEFTLEEKTAPHEGEYPSLEISYAGQTLSLPITIPPSPYADDLPGLTRYEDWMKIVRFAPLTGRSMQGLIEAMDAGEERDRLAVVVRSIRPGTNPETWGRVWRKDWVFDFYELTPGGTFNHERFAYPTARKVADVAEPREQGGIPELDSRSWQFQAADLLMPEGSAPRIIAGDSPLVAADWTFPAAIASVMVATAALLVAFAPARVGPAPASEL